jgi:prepilin-type N-terminal cleavage/methylation domain-containing protein
MKHDQQGMTLVEFIVAIVVIGVGLGGVLAATVPLLRMSNPQLQWQSMQLGDRVIQSLLTKDITAGQCAATAKCKVEDLFPQWGPAPALANFSITIETKKLSVTNTAEKMSQLINVAITHPEMGVMKLSALKPIEDKGSELSKRVYTF